ncbi:oxysterol-binding protein homolog 4 [Monosporozyma unispora]|nr:Oxysterol binding protein [Kazachstania unispora]
MTEYAETVSWSSFLKSISSFSGDLSALSAPPFILSPVSLSEFSQYWGTYQDLFLAIAQINKQNYQAYYPQIRSIDTPEVTRMLAVLQWYLATLKCQYTSRTQKGGFEKKPLNPFLGEVFVGKWENNETKKGDTVFLSEQVSHHPPVNAFAVINEENNIQLQGYTQIKSSFSKTLKLNVKQHGHAIIDANGNSFLITLPAIHLEGMLVASPYVELEDKSYIQSSCGMIWRIEYSGKGYFSGQKNSFKANLYVNSTVMEKEGKPIYTVSGQWSGASTILDGSKEVLFSDISRYQPHSLQVKPIDNQHDLESRKAWDDVAKAIELGDMKLISQTKNKLENHQRKLRRKEEQENKHWQNRWFKRVDVIKAKTEPDLEGEAINKLVALAKLSGLSIKNIPSGSKHNTKEHKKATTASHWSFVMNNWLNEKEIKI